MRRFFAALLALAISISASSSSLISCSPKNTPPADMPVVPPEEERQDIDTSVITPGFQDYDRDTVKFSELEYARPDVEAISESIRNVAAAISGGSLGFDAELERIMSIEGDYATVKSMRTLAEIYNMKDLNDEFWSAEYAYMSTSYPIFTDAIEDLFVACATSENKERFESEYFSFSLDEYKDGEIYTEAAVALMQEEARLENRYSSLSMSTVTITYQGRTDTAQNILLWLRGKYSEESQIYELAKNECMALYEKKLATLSEDIFIELIKTRRALSDELGYSSYTEYAYRSMGYDYSEEEMSEFLLSIKTTATPILLRLYTLVFNGFFYSSEFSQTQSNEIMNSLFEIYNNSSPILSEAYSYMLQYELYDVAPVAIERFPGSFTTYIDSNNSPYLFVTAAADTRDYITLSHEFGHFVDGYINSGASVSLDISEVSSQALELLTVLMLKDVINSTDHRMLEYYQMYSALNVLLMQGFYAAFEHLVYDIEYDDINKNSVKTAVENASKIIFGEVYYSDVSSVIITHTMLYPHYVESYCTSIAASLEIFFLEVECSGAGLEVYIDLITRDSDEERTFVEELEAVGLSSPFKKGYLKNISDAVYYHVLGCHYFRDSSDNANSCNLDVLMDCA